MKSKHLFRGLLMSVVWAIPASLLAEDVQIRFQLESKGGATLTGLGGKALKFQKGKDKGTKILGHSHNGRLTSQWQKHTVSFVADQAGKVTLVLRTKAGTSAAFDHVSGVRNGGFEELKDDGSVRYWWKIKPEQVVENPAQAHSGEKFIYASGYQGPGCVFNVNGGEEITLSFYAKIYQPAS